MRKLTESFSALVLLSALLSRETSAAQGNNASSSVAASSAATNTASRTEASSGANLAANPAPPASLSTAPADALPSSANPGSDQQGDTTKKSLTKSLAPSLAKVAPRAKPKAKPAKRKGSEGPPARKATRTAGPAREADPAARRAIAGPVSADDMSRASLDTPELVALRDAERELFLGAGAAASPILPFDKPTSIIDDTTRPVVHAWGLPPPSSLVPTRVSPPSLSTAWLNALTLPDLPVRWHERVVRYLDFYKNDPRGRAIVSIWLRRCGRYETNIRHILRINGVPEDLFWVSVVESSLNPTAFSPAGAAGLWQFIPETARLYGLVVDRWVDERLDPERATHAAAKYLHDLHQRFGTWELALAAYNMGLGGLLAAVRKYNTNDFWDLAQYEAGIPWETTLYVPKILAVAVVAKNPAMFGYDGLKRDSTIPADQVEVAAGMSLSSIAAAAKTDVVTLQSLNPQILASRVPPESSLNNTAELWTLRVPEGTAPRVLANIAKERAKEPTFDRHVVRPGETLQDIAQSRGASLAHLASINDVATDETPRTGTVLLVPRRPKMGPGNDATTGKPLVVVPVDLPIPPGYRRVFYRAFSGDTLDDVASRLGVMPDDLRRWNALSANAKLQEGMSLVAVVPARYKTAEVTVREERDVRVVLVGSDAFFGHFEALRDRVRTRLAVRPGDTWRSLAQRSGASVASLERINRRSRTTELVAGEHVTVYVSSNTELAKRLATTRREQDQAQTQPATFLREVHSDPSADSDADDPTNDSDLGADSPSSPSPAASGTTGSETMSSR